jgi:hypothetical protein
MKTAPRCCFTARNHCSAGILPSVASEMSWVLDWAKNCPDEASGGYVGVALVAAALAGVDVEAQDCIYFYRLVAAKYRAELPAG